MENQNAALIAAIFATITTVIIKMVDWLINRNTNWQVEVKQIREQLEEYQDKLLQCERQTAQFLMRIAQLEFMLGLNRREGISENKKD